MAKRTYGEACAAAHALDLVGERWALLVVRELILGPKRFADLRAGVPNASPDVLSRRLKELEEYGIVRRRKLPPPAASRVYELTEWGEELESVIVSLGRWGARSTHLPLDAGMGTDSLILSFRTMFDAGKAKGLDTTIELRIGEDTFRATVSGGDFDIERGSMDSPDASIEGDVGSIISLVYERKPLETTIKNGDVKVEGDQKAVERFLDLFPLPEPAGE